MPSSSTRTAADASPNGSSSTRRTRRARDRAPRRREHRVERCRKQPRLALAPRRARSLLGRAAHQDADDERDREEHERREHVSGARRTAGGTAAPRKERQGERREDAATRPRPQTADDRRDHDREQEQARWRPPARRGRARWRLRRRPRARSPAITAPRAAQPAGIVARSAPSPPSSSRRLIVPCLSARIALHVIFTPPDAILHAPLTGVARHSHQRLQHPPNQARRPDGALQLRRPSGPRPFVAALRAVRTSSTTASGTCRTTLSRGHPSSSDAPRCESSSWAAAVSVPSSRTSSSPTATMSR